MVSQALRTFLFRVHAWIGLNICIALGVISASGTVLVFAAEVEALFYTNAPQVQASGDGEISLGRVYDSVRTAYQDTRVIYIRRTIIGEWIGDTTTVNTGWGEQAVVWTAKSTGEILGAQPAKGFQKALREFHDSLFGGTPFGRLIVTASAFALTGSIVTGLISYRRFWRGFFKLPSSGRNSRAKWAGLHKLIAVWNLPFLLVVALTGIYYFVAAFGLVPSHHTKPKAAVERQTILPAGFNGAILNKAADVARATLSGFEITVVGLPNQLKNGIVFIGKEEATILPLGASTVTIDPTTFAVLGSTRASKSHINTQLKGLAEDLHHGKWGGSASRVLWLIFGTFATALLASGAMVYASRTLRLSPTDSEQGPAKTAMRRVWRGMDLSRFCSGLFRAILSMKETRNGTKVQRRIQARCGSHCYDKRADATADCVRFGGRRFDPEQVGSEVSAR